MEDIYWVCDACKDRRAPKPKGNPPEGWGVARTSAGMGRVGLHICLVCLPAVIRQLSAFLPRKRRARKTVKPKK